ncbi:MAG: ABC transporter ATP-binding protein [Deltaproteobacteria bacterium]|nr:ABC transporter ATP-binding protein [Deltaproteobacteria bacterium]
MSTPAIHVEGVGKRFVIGARIRQADTLVATLAIAASRQLGRMRSLIARGFQADRGREDFWALREISFEVQPGQVLGIIGRNGSGKSTLLKILSRITPPTEGKATIVGRVGSLLEIGTGFHNELTGRENIFLSGAILGMKKNEIRARFDEIVAFSGVEQFIDTPVKHYSSGMYLRLAFAVAAHLRTEILLIDEVLAVGDAAFQKRCIDKMSEVAREGRTVLFVSHNLGAVLRLCSTGLLLDSGHIVERGMIGDVISAYGRLGEKQDNDEDDGCRSREGVGVSALDLLDGAADMHPSKPVGLGFTLNVRRPYWALHVLIGIQALEGWQLVIEAVDSAQFTKLKEEGNHRVELRFPPLWLRPGSYTGWVKVIAYPQQGVTERFLLEIPVTCNGPVDVNMDRLLAPKADWCVRTLNHAKAELGENACVE